MKSKNFGRHKIFSFPVARTYFKNVSHLDGLFKGKESKIDLKPPDEEQSRKRLRH